jgi:hypothetical protein
MAHINLPSDSPPGISGLLIHRPDTAKPLRELVEILLRGESTLSRGEREIIASLCRRLGHLVMAGDGKISRDWAKDGTRELFAALSTTQILGGRPRSTTLRAERPASVAAVYDRRFRAQAGIAALPRQEYPA